MYDQPRNRPAPIATNTNSPTPMTDTIEAQRVRLASQSARIAELEAALAGLLDALTPGKGTLTDAVVPSYDAARALLAGGAR